MGGDVIGLVAVILSLGIPIAGMFTYYRVRKLRSEERLAAVARGVGISMGAGGFPVWRLRRFGIFCISGAVGFIATVSGNFRVCSGAGALRLGERGVGGEGR